MQFKTLLKQPVFIGSSAGIVFSLIFLLISNLPSQSSYIKLVPPANLLAEQAESSQTPQNLIAGRSAGMPVRLKIPSINVDSAVENVGLASDGAMDVPKDSVDVGWFSLGQRPGEEGSAVIAGHFGRKNKKGSVFDNLHKLRKGDKFYIEDDQGLIITFVVREIRRFDPNAETTDIFVSSDGKSHLNLITCEGDWDKTAQQYTKRLVVFADKE